MAPTVSASVLFEPFRLGSLELPNRIVMAPLTRCRAGHGTDALGAPAAAYYAQRASAGLIISEATQISPQGKGYPWTPGIYSEAQIEGWRQVAEGLHAKGGRIFAQLWHVGRISHPSHQPGGALPVAPSAVKPAGQAFTEAGFADFVTPRALGLDEIPGIVAQYRQAALNAKAAGLDGIELHAANGYLLDQFLRDGTNKRTDAYGGSIGNRMRLTLEVVKAVTEVMPPDRVGIRIAPASTVNDISDSDPNALFGSLIEALNPFGLAYLHVVEGITGVTRDPGEVDFKALRRAFKGAYMANNLYTRELAAEAVASGNADLIAFGRPFIANPDLVERLRLGAALNVPDVTTFYGGGEQGYLDYPTLAGGEA